MLESLKANIEKILALYEGEKQRSDELFSQLSDANRQIESLKQQNTELKRKVDNQALGGAIFGTAEDNREARARIDKLVGEIDRCIELLGN